jgi:hypothetical protein
VEPLLRIARGDTVFATDLLPDGRIVCEIAHRSPFEAHGSALRTGIAVRVYIIDLEGNVSVVAGKRLGQFAAAGPRGELYFLETGRARPGSRSPQVRRVVLQ